MISSTRSVMGMTVTVTTADNAANQTDVDAAFAEFKRIDQKFSTYKQQSEITQLNDGRLSFDNISAEMQEIWRLAEQTKQQTDGYFDIGPIGRCDPSGIVKGWAIDRAAKILYQRGLRNYYVNAGGDIQAIGHQEDGSPWPIGIRHPFEPTTNCQVVRLSNAAVATSALYERGPHIYNPKRGREPAKEIASLSVIASNIYDADRLATAAFAMGKKGIAFIARLRGIEGYAIDWNGQATYTPGFLAYC